jgi:hypothetical protein
MVIQTSSKACPGSFWIGTWGTSPGVNQPKCEVNHLTPFRAENIYSLQTWNKIYILDRTVLWSVTDQPILYFSILLHITCKTHRSTNIHITCKTHRSTNIDSYRSDGQANCNRDITLKIGVGGFFRLCNINIVGFFSIYLIATCFGHTTIFKQTHIF